jgi:hypothetical protein
MQGPLVVVIVAAEKLVFVFPMMVKRFNGSFCELELPPGLLLRVGFVSTDEPPRLPVHYMMGEILKF